MDTSKLVKHSFDLHVHCGPELIPRQFDPIELAQHVKGKIRGCMIESHFSSTAEWAKIANKAVGSQVLYGSLALNWSVGGINIDAVNSSLAVGAKSICMPTIHASGHLEKHEWDVNPAWVGGTARFSRRSSEITPVPILDSTGELRHEVLRVLEAIKDADAILATGNLNRRETMSLVTKAQKMDLRRIFITHPLYMSTNLSIAEQRKLTKREDTYAEYAYVLNTIDNIPMKKIADAIQGVEPENCILTSDVGQVRSPGPPEALRLFAKALISEGISRTDLETMLVTNPTNLLMS